MITAILVAVAVAFGVTATPADPPPPPPIGANAAPFGAPLPDGCVSGYRGLPGEDPTVEICDSLDVDQAQSDPVADCLIALGYRGVSDGRERIFAPAADIDQCVATVESGWEMRAA